MSEGIEHGSRERERALEELYRAQGKRLWWALLGYAGSREIASDAVAEAFARALASPKVIRDPARWVWRVAFRVATAELRDARARSSSAEIPVAHYEMDQGAFEVIEALRILTDKQRAAFVLFYLEDRPAAEIAKLLGMSRSTVAVHLHRARNRIRETLEADDG